MADKQIVQHDRPSVLYSKPISRWVGQFVGQANMVSATVRGASAETVLGAIELDQDYPSGQADVLIRPEHLEMLPGGAAALSWLSITGMTPCMPFAWLMAWWSRRFCQAHPRSLTTAQRLSCAMSARLPRYLPRTMRLPGIDS